MPTLDELSKSSRTERVQLTGATGEATQAVSTQQEKLLMKDLESLGQLTEGAAKTSGAVYEASVWADEKRADDAHLNYINGLKSIDDYYKAIVDGDEANPPRVLTVQDYKDKRRWQKDFYKDSITGSITSADKDSDIYKNRFLTPSAEMLKKVDDNDSANQFAAFKIQTKEEVDAEIEMEGSETTYEKVISKADRMKTAGYANSKSYVWSQTANSLNSEFTDRFKDGVDSTSLTQYTTEGILTQEGIDRLFNDTYGRIGTRKDGVYNKTYADQTDESWESMKKSFNGWIDNYNKSRVTKAKKFLLTIDESNAKMDVKTTTLTEATKTLNESLGHLSKAMTLQPDKDYSSDKDHVSKMLTKTKTIEMLNSSYNQIISGDKSYSEVMSEEHVVTSQERLVAKGIPITTATSRITKAEKKAYLDNRIAKEIGATINNQGMEQSSTLGVNIGNMHSDGYAGEGTKMISDNIVSFNKSGYTGATNSTQLLNSLHLNHTYLKTYGNNNSSWINSNSVKEIETYRTQLEDKAETDDRLTPNIILSKIKQKTWTMAKEWTSKNEGSRLQKFLSDADIVTDDLVAGGIWGETTLVNGVFNSLLTMAESSGGKPIRTKEELITFAKEKTIEIDDSWLPVGGTSFSFINPTTNSSTSMKNKVRSNMQTLISSDLSHLKGVDVNVSDLSDEDHVDIIQVPDVNGEMLTTINVYSGRNIIMTSIYTSRELRTGRREYRLPKELR